MCNVSYNVRFVLFEQDPQPNIFFALRHRLARELVGPTPEGKARVQPLSGK